MTNVIQILSAMQKGDPKSADELLPRVYQELRRLAAGRMANELPGHTLQPTALVREAWPLPMTAKFPCFNPVPANSNAVLAGRRDKLKRQQLNCS